MFKFLNKTAFEKEKNRYFKLPVKYRSYTALIADERIVHDRQSSELKGKFFASTKEDRVLARLLKGE